MWWDYWPTPFFFGPVIMIVMVVFCMGMMIFMMRGHGRSSSGNALDILSDRFARGEINQAEYDERKRVLRS